MLATRINLHELQTINRFEQSMGVEGYIMEVKLLCAKVHTEGGGGGGVTVSSMHGSTETMYRIN